MELLQSGVDRTLIALWLGHESVETTQIYLDANLAIKEEILAMPNRLDRLSAPTHRQMQMFHTRFGIIRDSA
jgi:hypothetical protein